MDEWSDRHTDGGDCITFHSNTISKYITSSKCQHTVVFDVWNVQMKWIQQIIW